MTSEHNWETIDDGASGRLTEALIVALSRVPPAPSLPHAPGPPTLPDDVTSAIAAFVGALRATGMTPENMLVVFKRLLKSTAALGAWQVPGVERALISAAITSYFNGPTLSHTELASRPESTGRGRTVLVVDDNEDSRFILGVMLQGEGIDALLASNGAEAVLIARHARPSLILLDLAMPGVDGSQVLLLLRRLTEVHATPVVAITAFPTLARASDLLERGFAEVLMKPIGPADLRRVFRRHSPALLPANEES